MNDLSTSIYDWGMILEFNTITWLLYSEFKHIWDMFCMSHHILSFEKNAMSFQQVAELQAPVDAVEALLPRLPRLFELFAAEVQDQSTKGQELQWVY